MTIPVQQFPILSAQQSNPLGAGLSTGQDLYHSFILNKYLPQILQQQSKQTELQNALSALNLQNAPEEAKQKLLGLTLNNQLAKEKIDNPFLMNPEGALYDYAFKQQQGQMGQPQIGGEQSNNSGSNLNNNLINNILANKFMSPEQKAQMQIQNATQIDSIKQNNRDYQKELDSASKDAITSRELTKSLDQLGNSYNKLSDYERGPLSGHLPAFSSNAQLADNAANNLQAQMVRSVANGGRVTNYLTKFTGTLKPNRSMTPAALKELTTYMNANAVRQQEYPSFLIAAREKGIDAQTAKTLWNQYDEQRPVYNFTKKKVNDYSNKNYNDYLSDEAINAVKNGGFYNPNKTQSALSKDNKSKDISDNNEISISGKKYRRVGPNQWKPIE